MTAPDPSARSPADPSRARHGRLLLAGLLLLLVVLKLLHLAQEPEGGPDAAYYYDIATHVRDGDGLVTDVSLFYAGYPRFPHPTAVYPLWPLLLGLSARDRGRFARTLVAEATGLSGYSVYRRRAAGDPPGAMPVPPCSKDHTPQSADPDD